MTLSERLLNHFQKRMPTIINLTRHLVEIESPSRHEEGIRWMTETLAREARRIREGLIIKKTDFPGIGEHLSIQIFDKENFDVQPIMLLGHTDTVYPLGSLKKQPFRIENNRAYAPGIFDMKANCLLTLEVLRAFEVLKCKVPRPIHILLTCDEEIGSPTGRALVESEARKAVACLVLEPSAQGRVKTGRKGTAGYTLRARGIPAHAGLEPERGASAILELARQIESLHELNSFQQGTTVTIGTIKGGTASNVVPEFAECEIDVRFRTLAEAKRVENEIKSLQSFDGRVTLAAVGELNRPPLERTETVVALYRKARDLAAEFHYGLGETQVGGASDGNFVQAVGVPVLDGLGIAGDGAHTNDEYILLDDIPKRATLIAQLLLSI